MSKSILTALVVAATITMLMGCSGSANPNLGGGPTSPQVASSQTQQQQSDPRTLWGLWHCTMNPETMQIEATQLRTAMFTANVNNLLEVKPGNLVIGELDLTNYFTQGRIDCTVTLKHPLPGLYQYDGFDVWGVFMHNGNSQLQYDSLTYGKGPGAAEDEASLLNADGYTRWYNQPEFDGNGIPIIEYWPGKLSNLPMPTAKLNPYKIFADGIDTNTDYYEWAKVPTNTADRGVFRAGTAHSRRYQLQFPLIGGQPKLDFQYAVVATWEPGDPTKTGNPATFEPGDFPTSANVEEAFFVQASTVGSSLYNNGQGQSGGSFRAQIEIFDWQGGTVGGNGVPNEINRMIVEGSFLPGGTFEMSQAQLAAIAQPGTENSSVFQVDIAGCTPQASGPTDFWVIVESAGLNGSTYGQGFPTKFPDPARRAAFIRKQVNVMGNNGNIPPTITGIEDDIVGPGDYKNPVTKCDTSVTYSAIYQDPDVGQDHTFQWWIVPDGGTPGPSNLVTMPVDWSTYAAGEYDIYVEVNDGFDPVTAGPFDISLIFIHWQFDTITSFTSLYLPQYSEMDDIGPAIAEESDGDIGLSWADTDTNNIDPSSDSWWFLKRSTDNGVTYLNDGYRDGAYNLTRADCDKICASPTKPVSYATSRFEVPNHLNYISEVAAGWPMNSGVFVANADRDMEIVTDLNGYVYAFDDAGASIGEKHSQAPDTLTPWEWQQPPYVRFHVAPSGYCSHVRSTDVDSKGVVWIAYYSSDETGILLANSSGTSPYESWDADTVAYTASSLYNTVKDPGLFIDLDDIFHMCYTRLNGSTGKYELVYLKSDSSFSNPVEHVIVQSTDTINDACISVGNKFSTQIIVIVYETGKSVFLQTLIDGIAMCPPEEIDGSTNDIDPDAILDADQCDFHTVWSTMDGTNYDLARRNGVLVKD